MAPRQPGDLIAVGKKKPIGAHQERVSPLLNKVRKGRLDLAWATCIHEQQANPKSTRRNLHHSRFALLITGVGRVAEVSDRRGRRHQFEQQLKALPGRFGQQEIDAGKIPTRSVWTVDEADPYRVGALHKNDRDRLGRPFGGKRTTCALQYNDHGYLTANQFSDQRRQRIVSTLRPAVFDRHVLVLDVTGVTQASAKSGEILAVRFERCKVKKPNHRHRRLLRARRARPSGSRTAEKIDELTPLHVSPRTRLVLCLSLALCEWAASEKWHPNRPQILIRLDVSVGSNTSFCACVDHFRSLPISGQLQTVGTSNLTHIAAGFFIRPL